MAEAAWGPRVNQCVLLQSGPKKRQLLLVAFYDIFRVLTKYPALRETLLLTLSLNALKNSVR